MTEVSGTIEQLGNYVPIEVQEWARENDYPELRYVDGRWFGDGPQIYIPVPYSPPSDSPPPIDTGAIEGVTPIMANNIEEVMQLGYMIPEQFLVRQTQEFDEELRSIRTKYSQLDRRYKKQVEATKGMYLICSAVTLPFFVQVLLQQQWTNAVIILLIFGIASCVYLDAKDIDQSK